MTTLDLTMTVGSLVAGRPNRARVFENYGIDYCCGGEQSLAEACVTKRIALDELESALLEADANAATPGPELDWATLPLTEMVDHLLETHHVFLKTELPRLGDLVDKVANVHGNNHPELREIQTTYRSLVNELLPHMQKEEQILFPMIKMMDVASGPQAFHCGSIGNPISVMEHEHDVAGHLLRRLRELTSNFTLPAEACNSYRALYAGLEELEFDTHVHIHKENSFLFPRAITREAGLEDQPRACSI